MAGMFEYLHWRGDILFSQLPPNPVDMLIFSTLAYINYGGVVSDDVRLTAPLRTAARTILALGDAKERCRVEKDLDLLRAAGESPRFANVRLTFYRDVFIPEEDTQFAAITFLLDDNSACLAFRGTDNTLVGWKEDFNMTFQDIIPAQRLAQEYVQEFAEARDMPLRLTGHSKGGNLGVYAAARSGTLLQKRIIEISNHDGPGFTEHMLSDPGYLSIVPKIRTYVPQSSVFGMLLERKEDHTIVRSRRVSLLQHDPYSWEVMGAGFVPEGNLTADSLFLDRTFENWLAGMSAEERNAFFDAVFELLMTENTKAPKDVLKPQNIIALVKTLRVDEQTRHTIASVLNRLIQSAKDANF